MLTGFKILFNWSSGFKHARFSVRFVGTTIIKTSDPYTLFRNTAAAGALIPYIIADIAWIRPSTNESLNTVPKIQNKKRLFVIPSLSSSDTLRRQTFEAGVGSRKKMARLRANDADHILLEKHGCLYVPRTAHSHLSVVLVWQLWGNWVCIEFDYGRTYSDVTRTVVTAPCVDLATTRHYERPQSFKT